MAFYYTEVGVNVIHMRGESYNGSVGQEICTGEKGIV